MATSSSTAPLDPRSSKILIVGTGVAGIRAAKTLLDDGFAYVHLISETLSAGGVWALDDLGMSYPGLATNSGIGQYEYSEMSVNESDEFLRNNENCISGPTIGKYLEEYFTRFVRDRASTRFGHKVVSMDRPEGSPTGWRIVVRDLKTNKTTEELWDKVVLCTGWTPSIAMPAPFTDPAVVDPFNGILTHSSKITSSLHDKILALPPSTTKIVIVGIGKSAVDLGGIYAGLGRDVTVVFRKSKAYAPESKQTEVIVKTRMASTLSPPHRVRTNLEWFLANTRLGSAFLHLLTDRMMGQWAHKLRIAPGSDLDYLGPKTFLWLGAPNMGGRAMSGPKSFHMLAAEGKIKTIAGVTPQSISADGNGLVLSDGQTLPADVIIFATGFGPSWSFVPRDLRVQLGLEPVAPIASTNKYEGLKDYPILQPVPAPPRSDAATHIYHGIVPYGALHTRDLAIAGGAYALKYPFICEIATHWISSFFLGSSHLHRNLPSSAQEAFDEAEDHADWIRARYPMAAFPWGNLGYAAFLNTDQYIETLFEDMSVKSIRRDPGWFGLGFYFGKLTPAAIEDLGFERRALRVAAGEEKE